MERMSKEERTGELRGSSREPGRRGGGSCREPASLRDTTSRNHIPQMLSRLNDATFFNCFLFFFLHFSYSCSFDLYCICWGRNDWHHQRTEMDDPVMQTHLPSLRRKIFIKTGMWLLLCCFCR